MSRRPLTPRGHQPDGESGAGPAVALILIWGAVAAGAVGIWVLPDQTGQLLAAFVALGAGLALCATLLARALRQGADLADRLGQMDARLAQMQAQLAEPVVAPVSPIAHSKIEALAAAQEQTDTRLTLFFSRRNRETGAPVPLSEGEPLLALGDPQPQHAAPLAPGLLIRALHFPEDADDADGFTALRLALADARTATLIRAAQEVLTHLAQDGIYMDDLRPDRARPEFWRAFAQGTRGALIAPLGGIRDRSCLALTAARMRNNPDFKAASHLFLREFDKVFASFEADADDAQIAALSETRSARAFMLLGRVNGVFSR